jgi:transposase
MLTKKERELIIKLKEDGKKQEDIARLLDCSQAAVSKWISKHKKGRTLETLPRSGRPTKLTKEIKTILKAKLSNEIRKANDKYGSVSTKNLAKIIEQETGKSYVLRHVARILHELKFSLVTPRSQHLKHDAKKVEEFQIKLKKNLKKNTWVEY